MALSSYDDSAMLLCTSGFVDDMFFAARCYVIDSAVYAVVVCPSFRPSVLHKPVAYCTETAKHRITQTTPYDSAKDLGEI